MQRGRIVVVHITTDHEYVISMKCRFGRMLMHTMLMHTMLLVDIVYSVFRIQKNNRKFNGRCVVLLHSLHYAKLFVNGAMLSLSMQLCCVSFALSKGE